MQNQKIATISVKKTGVTDDTSKRENTEYSSHALAKVVDGKTGMSESWLQDPGLVINENTKIDKGKKRIKDNRYCSTACWMGDLCVLEKIYKWLKRDETRDTEDKNKEGGPSPPSNHSF